jgi:hypothetical protein
VPSPAYPRKAQPRLSIRTCFFVITGLAVKAICAGSTPVPAQSLSAEPQLVVRQEYLSPVITTRSAGAEDIKYGFESGTTLKLEGTYHLFVSEMVGDPFWVRMRLAHWTSTDRLIWKRRETIRASSGDFSGRDPRAALWSPTVVWDEEQKRWNLFYVAYHSSPSTEREFLTNARGRIWRAVSQTIGQGGISGPYVDQGIVLEPGLRSDPWEGLQGVDSFYPWKVGDSWYAFYGSANTERLPVEHWRVGLAKAATLAGPWMRLSRMNPVQIERKFIENPIVTKLNGNGWLCVYDSDEPDCIGWAYSFDGITWLPGHALRVQRRATGWADDVRTPLGLVDEGDGRYTLLYTGFEKLGDPRAKDSARCAVGLVELEIHR